MSSHSQISKQPGGSIDAKTLQPVSSHTYGLS